MSAESEEEEADIGASGCNNCDEVPEEEMLVVDDQNFNYPWKGGNRYSRICPECSGRTFCAGSYWESKNTDPDEVAYVIEKGEEDIRPVYDCPYTEDVVGDDGEPCGEPFHGTPLGEDPLDECPNCNRDFNWE